MVQFHLAYLVYQTNKHAYQPCQTTRQKNMPITTYYLNQIIGSVICHFPYRGLPSARFPARYALSELRERKPSPWGYTGDQLGKKEVPVNMECLIKVKDQRPGKRPNGWMVRQLIGRDAGNYPEAEVLQRVNC